MCYPKRQQLLGTLFKKKIYFKLLNNKSPRNISLNYHAIIDLYIIFFIVFTTELENILRIFFEYIHQRSKN